MQIKNNKSHSKLIRNGLIPNLYSSDLKIRSPLLISLVMYLKC